jgi:GNAT superfamily N-acetyltransferase
MIFLDSELARRLEIASHPAMPEQGTETDNGLGKVELGIGGGVAVFAGVDSPMTQAEGLGLHGEMGSTEMDRLEDFFHSRGSAVVVELCPLADASLLGAFGERGYRIVEFSNVLIRALAPSDMLAPEVTRIEVRPIVESERSVFVETLAQGWAEFHAVTDEMVAMTESFSCGEGKVMYLALADGKPAGAGTLLLSRGVAGLYGSSTMPEFRKRGIQTALIARRMADARATGCDIAMAVTLPGSGSQRNFERHGFRVVYTRTKLMLPAPVGAE